MAWALLLCALAAGEPPANQPTFEAPGEVGGWHFAGIPLASYGSDVGLTLGAGVFFYRAIEDHPEEHDQLTLSFSLATRGPRTLDATWDDRRILGTGLRTTWNVHLADDDRMPYWGEGARLGGLSTPAGFGTPPEPYRYHDRRLFSAFTVRGPLPAALAWHLRLRYLNVDVAGPSELLATARPDGARGGRVALGEVGLLWDTRDRELAPRRGTFLAASVFAAPRLPGFSDHAFHGYDATARVYLPLVLGLTLAARALYDRKLGGVPFAGGQQAGAVPFFERTLYEGLAYGEGLGGSDTIRGIARYRLAGEEKMLLNVQLRAALFTTHLASKTQEYGLDVGVDAGRARQPGYPALLDAALTAGFRFIWDGAILVRIDVGRARGGDNTLYVSFGEQF